MELNLEQISDENLVNFYKEELHMIDLGEPVSTFFTPSVRKRLLKKGILKRAHPRITTISDWTRAIISQEQ